MPGNNLAADYADQINHLTAQVTELSRLVEHMAQIMVPVSPETLAYLEMNNLFVDKQWLKDAIADRDRRRQANRSK